MRKPAQTPPMMTGVSRGASVLIVPAFGFLKRSTRRERNVVHADRSRIVKRLKPLVDEFDV
jgi:hypothetical protein